MKLLCAMLCLGSVLGSFVPIFNFHQLQLPFVSSPDSLEMGMTWKLAMNFSLQEGGLYANEHRLYPPSGEMQLQAPLYNDASQYTHNGKTVQLSHSLETQIVHKSEIGTIEDTTLVRIEFLDLRGNLVSPHAVAIHLHVCEDGKFEMDRFRIEPARSGSRGDSSLRKSPLWVVKYWELQSGTISDTIENTPPAPVSAPGTNNSTLRGTGEKYFSVWTPRAPSNLTVYLVSSSTSFSLLCCVLPLGWWLVWSGSPSDACR
ncbi:uncharacterized protein N7500_002743 [Penicillium coprophilum]|uniref:uncharacterized protein n=1 Tax=Penicillium coprophilum TaxID=36646 RepID=UPI0023A19A0A|nr:uncharacterized protein N7500_002743 [Penicillium coprophilum]KAJ5169960.1 hypothetical protein N7500_002743 [Penicillium coprophilum]